MAETFKLPASSYEELLKLFQAYANTKEGVALSLDQINQLTGISRTTVSKNNGFMVQVGLITEGNKKAATDIGRDLGRAYASKIDYEVERIWKEITTENDFLSRMISAVRIRNGMDRTNFINHIIYSSGIKDSKEARAGAGAIVEILKSVNILNETDGKITVIEEKTLDTTIQSNVDEEVKETKIKNITQAKEELLSSSIHHGVVINVNINCSPNDLDMLGEKIKILLQKISE